MLTVQCYKSNSPESRDSIRVVVVTFVSLSGYREIYVEIFSTADSMRYFYKSKLMSWEGADSINFWQNNLGNYRPFRPNWNSLIVTMHKGLS